MVILTSFVRRNDFVGKQFSVARWAPKGVSLPALDFLAATGVGDRELRIRDFQDPIHEFASAYKAGLQERWRHVRLWLDEIDPKIDIVLCCWCPYSQHSQEEFAETGFFSCHTGLIGKLVQGFRKDVLVRMDADRLNYLVKEWRPND